MMKINLKKVLKNVSFMILLLKMCVVLSQKKVIVIDPGHGGKDSGAIGMNGIQEKEVVLNIAIAILKLNKTILYDTYEIYLTRYKDTLISLSDRTKLAKNLKADLFVSLHCNHSDNPNARGVEVYVTNSISKYAKNATWFAYQLQEAFRRQLGFESRGVKFANFQVLSKTIDNSPAVLLELGFLSNEDESEYYKENSNKMKVARAILESIITKTK